VRRTGSGARAIVVVEPSGRVEGERIDTISRGETAPSAVAAPFVGETMLFTPRREEAREVGEFGSFAEVGV
jgi:hypothetical protein